MQTCEVLDRESEAVSEAMSQPKLETTILSALKVKLSILDHEGWVILWHPVAAAISPPSCQVFPG